jgi:thiosulfate reductase cytochrome b subunit
MSDSHSEKYFSKLIVAISSLTGAVFVIFLCVFEKMAKQGDWYFWAAFVAFLLCAGVYFAIQAVTHKIKSDFSRRAKQRESFKNKAEDI